MSTPGLPPPPEQIAKAGFSELRYWQMEGYRRILLEFDDEDDGAWRWWTAWLESPEALDAFYAWMLSRL